MYMKSFTNISYFGVNTSELVIEKATYYIMIIEYFYSHKRSPLYLITKSSTVAAMAESVSTWSMRTPKTDSVGRVTKIIIHIVARSDFTASQKREY